jgi:tetratricopeptide (TPR) repeat protein
MGVLFSIIISICILVCDSSAFGADTLFSENTAAIFIKQAAEVHQEDPLDEVRTKQAIAFLEAAYALDPMAEGISEHLLQVTTANCFSQWNDQDSVRSILGAFLKDRSDVEVPLDTVGCMLEQLNTRNDRGILLARLGAKYSPTNPLFASELVSQLGFLAMEKADIATATNRFFNAFQLNRYNYLALSQFLELSKAQGSPVDPLSELILYRIRLTVNPYDLSAAVSYANMLQRLQIYDVATKAYEYAAELYAFQNPNSSLAPEILQSWVLSCYHVKHSEIKCLEIAEKYRDPAQFDPLLESVVGKALLKVGQIDRGNHILESTGRRLEALITESGSEKPNYPEHLAWFYSFVLEEPEKALAWGNQAFVQAPDRQGVKSVFSYTLAQNKQYELAMEYAEPLQAADQIAAITLALVQLSQEQNDVAIESLKKAIEMAPETLVAEKAIRFLADQDSEYISSVPSNTILEQLQKSYLQLVPEFSEPSTRFTAKLLFNGSDFLYGADFPARLVIENISSEPLVISNEGLLKGNLSIDAKLQGDLNVSIPNLYVMKFRPDKAIQPGKYLSLPLDLNRGKLRRLLLTYPQADVKVQFDVHLDTLVVGPTKVSNQEGRISLIQAEIRRQGILLTGSFLMQRLDVLAKGQVGQKYQASSLFTGLFAEQAAFQMNQADFSHHQVERVLLVDAIRKILSDRDWKVRVHAINRLSTLSIPLDREIILDISENLNHENWPVRLAAMYLLANLQSNSFQKVLDWTAEHDPSSFVREMAFALGAKEPVSKPIDQNGTFSE